MHPALTAESVIQASYLLTAFLFIVGLKRMSSPVSAGERPKFMASSPVWRRWS